MIRLYMLDTNTVSYIVKGVSEAARNRLLRLGPQEAACISAITEAELWYGLDRVGAGEARRKALREFFDLLRVLPWDRDEAVVYGSFRHRQEAMGRPLGSLDMQIAAHAIAAGAVLVSNDKGFRHAHGLVGLESWAPDVEPRAKRKRT